MGQKSISYSLMIVIFCLSGTVFAQTPLSQPLTSGPASKQDPQPHSTPPQIQDKLPKCDARPYQYLVGRTISDVLTVKLPPGTRIYRVGDPLSSEVNPGKLTIELNRGTRVARVYCS
ncbi:I78 family peptidase inhibitor [Candidatus Phycosocius spiralis]|uniref:Peptidase inhibitor I78 family protein n=1 Tax=Candidatus Phycosocius spiralis TaxID=2815099 RepID=A0ABQ4PSM0_9PROT|nr:hypothetical protein PsB1_0156 [Candidatus Phycosocius spiralis]